MAAFDELRVVDVDLAQLALDTLGTPESAAQFFAANGRYASLADGKRQDVVATLHAIGYGMPA